MIHDTQAERNEVIEWLKTHDMYICTISTSAMQDLHTMYWTMREEQWAMVPTAG